MTPLEDLYFEWLLSCIEPDGVTEGVAYVGGLLHNCEFERRVGNDMNRAVEGADLRKEFFSRFPAAPFREEDVETLLMRECTWLEMLIALSRHIDYTYDGGIYDRFLEMITNMQLSPLTVFKRRTKAIQKFDQQFVDRITSAIDKSQFSPTGQGGLFPLTKGHDRDQRRVEIWDQCSAYFRERLEGVLWTSTT